MRFVHHGGRFNLLLTGAHKGRYLARDVVLLRLILAVRLTRLIKEYPLQALGGAVHRPPPEMLAIG